VSADGGDVEGAVQSAGCATSGGESGRVGGAGIAWTVGVAGVTRRGKAEASFSGGVGVEGGLAGVASLGGADADGGVARNVGSTGWVACTVGDGDVVAVGGEFGDDADVARLGGGERRRSSSPS
jgi:hypothetical protein